MPPSGILGIEHRPGAFATPKLVNNRDGGVATGDA